MKKKWELLKVTHDFSILSDDEFKQNLAEFAELVYFQMCQLQKDKPLSVTSLQSSELVEKLTPTLRRTGTDG